MPFDQNGMWVDEVYPTAGPSGGATGALDLMNVMQSGQNYQREMAMKALMAQLQAAQNPNAGAIDPSLMAQATGQPADQWSNFYSRTPKGQMDTYVLNNPNASMEDIYTQQAKLGMVPPASVGAQIRQARGDTEKYRRELASLDFKGRKEVLDTAAKYKSLGEEDPMGLALQDWAAAHTGQETAPAPGVAPKVEAGIKKTKAETDFITGPKTQKTKAETALLGTKNDWYPLIASAQAASAMASAGHKDALAAASDLGIQIKTQEVTGGAMTPQDRINLRTKAQTVAQHLATLQKDMNVQAILKKGGPQADAMKGVMDGMALLIQDANKRAASAPGITVTSPVSRTTLGTSTTVPAAANPNDPLGILPPK